MKKLIILGLSIIIMAILCQCFYKMPVRKEPKATILRITNPRYSCCNKCGVPWKYVDTHCINWTKNRGVFYMCEDCWKESTIEERLIISKIAYEKYHKHTDINWIAICDSIKKGN